jgi:hypothetical protein
MIIIQKMASSFYGSTTQKNAQHAVTNSTATASISSEICEISDAFFKRLSPFEKQYWIFSRTIGSHRDGFTTFYKSKIIASNYPLEIGEITEEAYNRLSAFEKQRWSINRSIGSQFAGFITYYKPQVTTASILLETNEITDEVYNRLSYSERQKWSCSRSIGCQLGGFTTFYKLNTKPIHSSQYDILTAANKTLYKPMEYNSYTEDQYYELK